MVTTEEELRRAYINEQNLREYQRNKSALNRFSNALAKAKQLRSTYNKLMNSGNNISSLGKNMSNIGTKLQGSSNQYINALGNKIGNAGTNTQNFGNTLQNSINNRFNVNNTPAPNSSSVATQQQPTSMLGKMQNGLNQNTMGLTDMQNGQQTLSNMSGQQYTNGILGKTGLGNTGLTQGTGTVGNGVASSNLSSSLPMGADKLSFVGQGAGQTANGVGAGTTALGTTGSTVGTTAGTTGATLGSTAGTTAGTTAATAGSTAGTAAAGASSAIPVIGWGIAAAALIANMINSQRKKQQAKAMQASMQAVADNEVESEKEGQEAMQNIANQNQQFQSGGFGMQPTSQDINDAKVAELMSMINDGQITGGASGIDKQQIANILNTNLQQNNGQQGVVNSFAPVRNTQPGGLTVDEYGFAHDSNGNIVNTFVPVNKGTTTNGTAPVQQQPEQPTQLNGGVDQTSPSFGQQVYQTGGGTGRLAQVFDQIRQGYKDNTENTMGNTYFDPNQQKTFANRFGEALGTTQRIASNPYVQGLIAGGVNYANGGNFGNSTLTGIEWAKNKANSDRYEQLINGGNKRSLVGGYTASDYNTKLNQDYKEQQQKNWQTQQDYKKDKDEKDYNYKIEKDKRDYDEKVRHNKAQESATMARVKEYARHNGVSEAQSAKKLGVYTQYQKEKQQLAKDKFEWEKTHPKGNGSKTTTKKKEEENKNTVQGGWAF